MPNFFLQCSIIRPRQQSLECHLCHKHKHRTCGDHGITQTVYREYYNHSTQNISFRWTCQPCSDLSIQKNQSHIPEQGSDHSLNADSYYEYYYSDSIPAAHSTLDDAVDAPNEADKDTPA